MGRFTDEPAAQWTLRAPLEDGWRELIDEHNLHPLTARMVARRGHGDPESARRFLNPRLDRMHDPALMADMQRAVRTALDALESNASIVIHGDYDVDGLTSTALLYDFFTHFDADVDYVIPHRIDDGYGLDPDRISEIAERGCDLLITADCGVTAVDEITSAREAGMRVVVIDHHSVTGALPPADAVLNPQRSDCDFPFEDLSAAGVTFNFLVALRRAMRENGGFGEKPQPDLKRALELVALGTVADVVPLVDENRAFVHRGLQLMTERPRPGIRALLNVARDGGGRVTTNTVGYKLAPRLNAAGRIADASICVELMTSDDPGRAAEIAEHLDGLNSERRELQDEILAQADEQAAKQHASGDGLLVVDGDGWHRGVLGIVAGRLSDRYHRPVIALERHDGVAEGSARSIDGVDIVELLGTMEEMLDNYGGHAAAAGLTMDSERLPEFRERAMQELDTMLEGGELPQPSIEVEERVQLGVLDARFVEDLHRLRPFGAGNPEPVLACEEIRAKRARIVGKDHLKAEFTDGTGELGGIGFSMADYMEILEHPVAAAFVPKWSVFRGRGQLERHLRDLRPASNDLFAFEEHDES